MLTSLHIRNFKAWKDTGSIRLAPLTVIFGANSAGTGPLEEIMIRGENAHWCEARAKLVRAQFAQTISEHWRGRTIEWNRVQTPSGDMP